MPNQNQNQQNNVQAEKGLQLFYFHLGAYVLVNAVLCIITIFKNSGFLPFLLTSIAWGALVLFHAKKVLKA